MNSTELKILSSASLAEFKQLIQVFREVFEMTPEQGADDLYLQHLLEKTDFICMVVVINNTVTGGLTAYELPAYYGNYAEVYLYDIAIKQEQQRRGLGTQLIDALKNYCATRPVKTIFVEAEEQDTHAVNFYHRTKAEAQKVVHFNYYL